MGGEKDWCDSFSVKDRRAKNPKKKNPTNPTTKNQNQPTPHPKTTPPQQKKKPTNVRCMKGRTPRFLNRENLGRT